MLAFAILRYASASGKQSGDVAKSALEVASQVSAGRERQIEALDRNTVALRESATADLSAHKITHDNLTKLEDTQATMGADLRNLIAEFSALKIAMAATISDTKDQAKNVVQIALKLSSVENSIQRLVDKFYPNPANTQPIPEAVHIEARIISEGSVPAPELNPT